MLNPQKTPHTSPSQASYGVYSVNILDKSDRVATTPHCMCSIAQKRVYSIGVKCYGSITVMSYANHSILSQQQFEFVQQLVLSNNTENIKAPHYWTFMRWMHRWPMDASHKGPVKQKTFHVMSSFCASVCTPYCEITYPQLTERSLVGLLYLLPVMRVK